MKHNNLNLDQPVELALNLPFQTTPFIVTGQTEAIMDLAQSVQEADKHVPVQRTPKLIKSVVKPVEQPQDEYVPLLALSDRKRARLALKAWAYDLKSLGRTSMYDRFKTQLQDEQDARELVDLHLVQAVHCRLHEKQLQSVRNS